MRYISGGWRLPQPDGTLPHSCDRISPTCCRSAETLRSYDTISHPGLKQKRKVKPLLSKPPLHRRSATTWS